MAAPSRVAMMILSLPEVSSTFTSWSPSSREMARTPALRSVLTTLRSMRLTVPFWVTKNTLPPWSICRTGIMAVTRSSPEICSRLTMFMPLAEPALLSGTR